MVFFIPSHSLAAEKQGPGLKFSIENESFKPRMKISSENENFMRGGMVFSCVRARMIFSISGPSGCLGNINFGSFYLWLVVFTHGGGTIRKKDQI